LPTADFIDGFERVEKFNKTSIVNLISYNAPKYTKHTWLKIT